MKYQGWGWHVDFGPAEQYKKFVDNWDAIDWGEDKKDEAPPVPTDAHPKEKK